MGTKNNKAKRPKDKYYQLAKEQGYRARSAFKLIQLNSKLDFLRNSNVLIDLCAAPGGWLQVAAKYMPAGSMIVGVDLAPIKAIRGCVTHTEDITTPECRSVLKRDLGGRKADVVLHDGAPNVGQNWQKDAYTQSELVLSALKLAVEFLRPRGLFITKVFRSTDYNSLLWVFHQLFGRVEATKPHSSRTASAEIFVTCRDFKAPDKIDPKLLDPRHVFSEVDDLVGSGTGVAGGGGGHSVDVMHKKGDGRVRQREGYDETLGPLLTRRVPVLDFMRSDDPIRLLTDASCFLFDEEALAGGVGSHAATTDEVRACCADLKIIGKREFKTLLKWRLTLRHDLPPALTARPRRPRPGAAAAEEDGEGAEEEGADAAAADGDGSDGDADDDDDSDAEQYAELSAAAASELRRRKREKKREEKRRTKSLRRSKLGMDLRNVDLLDTAGDLFDLTAIKKLARRAREADGGDAGGAGGAGDDVLDSLLDVNLTSTQAEAEAAADAAGLGREGLGDGLDDTGLDDGGEGGPHGDDDEAGNDDASSSDSDSGSEAGEGTAGSSGGGVIDRLRRHAALSRLDEMEEDMDAAYARFLSKRQQRDAEAAAAAADGKKKGQPGIKLSRRAVLSQQAVVAMAAMDGKLDAEHAKYLHMLSGARGAAAAAAVNGGVGSSAAAAAAAVAASSASSAAAADSSFYGPSDEDEDEDGDSVSSDDSYEEAEGEAAQHTGAAAAAAPVLSSAAASRWFSNPLFADALAEEQLGGSGQQQQQQRRPLSGGAPATSARRPSGGVAATAAGSDSDASGDAYGVDSDGDVDPLSHIAPSDRDKWRTRLRKRRERADRVKERAAARDGDSMKVVRGQRDTVAADADSEFERAVGAAAREGEGGNDDDDGDDDDDSVTGGGRRQQRRKQQQKQSAQQFSDEEGEGGELTDKERARRSLIRAGMGAAVSAAEGGAASGSAAANGGGGAGRKRGRVESGSSAPPPATEGRSSKSSFEVVPAAPTPADDDASSDSDGGDSADTSPDPRDEVMDADEHAEILALGKMLKKHTTAKTLLDASYNRYAFEDGTISIAATTNGRGVGLPLWFSQDEDQHFKPQLPISRAEVDRIKLQFRDIAARPIARVAEARARKRRRVETKVAAAKKKAENIMESEELGGASKAKSVASLFRKATKEIKQKKLYAVFGKSGQKKTVGHRGTGKGKVIAVDGRMRKETRALKRQSKGKRKR